MIVKYTHEMTIQLDVKPLGKPRMTRADSWKRRPCVLRYREFCDKIRAAARKVGKIPNSNHVDLVIIKSDFAYPKSWGKKKKEAMKLERHRHKPDVDNISKGVMDALFSEDSGIADLHAYKRWGEKDSITVKIYHFDGE